MKDGAFGAMGGVQTSANDYVKWVAFLLSAWPARRWGRAGPTRRSSVREIVTGNNLIEGGMRDPASAAPCRQARAYAMAWRMTDDCDLGRVVGHSGGYPGYGSYLMLLPGQGHRESSLSRARPMEAHLLPVRRAALALKQAGALARPDVAGLCRVSPKPMPPRRRCGASQDTGAAPLANNVLMDHDRAAWAKMIR